MESIYSSKLYKASRRKDRIKAAMLAPGNVSLVQQLAEDLDEEYKVPENFGIEPEEKEESSAENNDLIVDEDIDLENDLVTIDDLGGAAKGSGSSRSGKGSSPKPSSPSKGEDKEPKEDDAAKDAIPDSPMTEEPAEASTKITSCVDIDLSVLKESLNSVADTHGVSRVAEKENEIWIYYKDEVNLNNIMTNVIEYMMNAGYVYLEFNRLARSDNAIVFQKENTTPIDFIKEEA